MTASDTVADKKAAHKLAKDQLRKAHEAEEKAFYEYIQAMSKEAGETADLIREALDG